MVSINQRGSLEDLEIIKKGDGGSAPIVEPPPFDQAKPEDLPPEVPPAPLVPLVPPAPPALAPSTELTPITPQPEREKILPPVEVQRAVLSCRMPVTLLDRLADAAHYYRKVREKQAIIEEALDTWLRAKGF